MPSSKLPTRIDGPNVLEKEMIVMFEHQSPESLADQIVHRVIIAGFCAGFVWAIASIEHI